MVLPARSESADIREEKLFALKPTMLRPTYHEGGSR